MYVSDQDYNAVPELQQHVSMGMTGCIFACLLVTNSPLLEYNVPSLFIVHHKYMFMILWGENFGEDSDTFILTALNK